MTVDSLFYKLAGLMSSDLPQFIAPARLAEATACIEGRLDLRNMDRLRGLLNDSQGVVDLKLAFSRDEHGFACITGRYETNLQLVCQRCLEPFATKLTHSISVGIVFDRAELNKLPETLEPLLLKQETLALSEFIEDEILLGLPISPVHRLKDCAADERVRKYGNVEENPFHVLKELKIKRDR